MIDVDVTGIATGGDGVGRLPDGRAVFVRGAIPGDRVRADVVDDKARFAKAVTVEVLDAGPGRVEATPPEHASCGACGWQHVDVATQRSLKARIVADVLTRLGRLDAAAVPEIDPGPDLPADGHRTTVRAGVDGDGRLGMRTPASRDVAAFADTRCPVPHPLVDEVLRLGRFPGAAEVVVRVGAATGERLVLVTPTVADETEVPDGVAVVGADQLAAGKRAWLHEEVAGRRYRISAESFFQARPDGAAALVDAVAAALAPAGGGRLVDLYAGVGLFAAALPATHATLVEANRSAVADARINVPGAKVVGADVRRWRPTATDAVVADPSRHGLGAEVVDRIVATGAGHVAVVSCDPGALGRDAGLLAKAGFTLGAVTLVDLFPHTPHVEVVTAWSRHPFGTAAP